MKTEWHNQDEIKDLVLLRQKHGRQWAGIANYLKRKYGSNHTANACSSKFYRMKEAGGLLDLAWELVAPEEPSYNELVEQWNEWLGRTVREIQSPTETVVGRRRIGIICDTHCPFEDRAVLAAFVADGPYDIVIHGGDLLDYYSVSSFVKRQSCNIKEEVQHGTWVLELLAGCGAQVIVVTDNHSKRILKALNKANLPPDLLELLQWFSPHLDLFKLMAEGLPNVRIADTTVPVRDGSTVTLSFLVQVGDLVVGHPDTASKIKLRSVEGFDDWLMEWKDTLGLAPWRAIGMGHTHQAGVAYGQGGGKLFMELGAAVTVTGMSYALQGKTGYRPPTPLYTVLTQERGDDNNWKTVFNSVHQVPVN